MTYKEHRETIQGTVVAVKISASCGRPNTMTLQLPDGREVSGRIPTILQPHQEDLHGRSVQFNVIIMKPTGVDHLRFLAPVDVEFTDLEVPLLTLREGLLLGLLLSTIALYFTF